MYNLIKSHYVVTNAQGSISLTLSQLRPKRAQRALYRATDYSNDFVYFLFMDVVKLPIIYFIYSKTF